MKASEIISFLEEVAPLSFQEDYDNSGLLIGDRETEVHRCLVCIDVTEDVVKEAIENKCQLIISHHPLIFGGIKKITGSTYTERVIRGAIKNDLSIYSIHTNLDNVVEGVNRKLAEMLSLTEIAILDRRRSVLRKLVVFCPSGQVEKVRKAILDAGAGQIGNYDSCSFNITGKGSFRAREGSNPFVGQIGEMHFEEEVRVEVIYPVNNEQSILTAMLEAHPYEEVAYDIYPLANEYPGAGAGMTGQLKEPKSEQEFMRFLKKTLHSGVIRHSRLLGKSISKVAICGGSGSFLLNNAIAAGADVFITGDVKYHQFFDADGKILLADVGHYESEQFTKELLAGYLIEKFPNFAVLISEVNTNPVHYF